MARPWPSLLRGDTCNEGEFIVSGASGRRSIARGAGAVLGSRLFGRTSPGTAGETIMRSQPEELAFAGIGGVGQYVASPSYINQGMGRPLQAS